jgi:hypothetical protein
MAKSPNRLLASVPSDVYSALTPHLKIVELKFGDVLAETGSEIRQVYFPYSGVISLVRTDVGSMIETAMVGHVGVFALVRDVPWTRRGEPCIPISRQYGLVSSALLDLRGASPRAGGHARGQAFPPRTKATIDRL